MDSRIVYVYGRYERSEIVTETATRGVPLLPTEEEKLLQKYIRSKQAQIELGAVPQSARYQSKRDKLQREIRVGKFAKDELVVRNYRLVVSIAKKHMGQGLTLEDLCQEGVLGLIKAIEKFDFKKGKRLSTYATRWIRQSIGRAVAVQSRTMRIPTHQFTNLGNIKKAAARLMTRNGYEPDPQEIAEELDYRYTPQEIAFLLEADRRTKPLSLDWESEDSDKEDVTFYNVIEDILAPDLENSAERALFIKRILPHLHKVSARAERIIRMRLGLPRDWIICSGSFDDVDCYPKHTLDEIAQLFGLTRERIRQIEWQQGYNKLREFLLEEEVEKCPRALEPVVFDYLPDVRYN